jgi:hypothetical protein
MSEPITVDLGDSWKPASLREAEARLNESLARSADLIKQVDEKLKQLPDVDHTAKPEDVSAIKAAAERPDAPAALRELKKKVDAGELSWQDVLEGKALKDETVREVMASRLGEMHEIYEEAEQGATLEEILEARGVTSGSVFGGGSSQSYSHTTPSAAPSEDDYFSGGVMNKAPSTPPPPPPAEPAPPTGGPAPRQDPRHTPPPRRREDPGHTPPPRRREESEEDAFENPLDSRERPKRPEPPRSAPPRGRRDRDEPNDDDYFGGPVLR